MHCLADVALTPVSLKILLQEIDWKKKEKKVMIHKLSLRLTLQITNK